MSNFCGRKCKNCGGKFHACTSCGLWYDWEYKYCSEKCWTSSKEHKHCEAVINSIISFADFSTKQHLSYLLDQPDSGYWMEFLERKLEESK